MTDEEEKPSPTLSKSANPQMLLSKIQRLVVRAEARIKKNCLSLLFSFHPLFCVVLQFDPQNLRDFKTCSNLPTPTGLSASRKFLSLYWAVNRRRSGLATTSTRAMKP